MVIISFNLLFRSSMCNVGKIKCFLSLVLSSCTFLNHYDFFQQYRQHQSFCHSLFTLAHLYKLQKNKNETFKQNSQKHQRFFLTKFSSPVLPVLWYHRRIKQWPLDNTLRHLTVFQSYMKMLPSSHFCRIQVGIFTINITKIKASSTVSLATKQRSIKYSSGISV